VQKSLEVGPVVSSSRLERSLVEELGEEIAVGSREVNESKGH
jgi:hypothetical protein